MTDLISYFRKTKATALLEQHFKPLSIAPNPAHVSFLHQINESACGGDDVSETPFAIILTDDESGRSILISRTDTSQVVFYGFFDDQHQAYDFACDYFIAELYQTPFAALAIAANQDEPADLSTESVDN